MGALLRCLSAFSILLCYAENFRKGFRLRTVSLRSEVVGNSRRQPATSGLRLSLIDTDHVQTIVGDICSGWNSRRQPATTGHRPSLIYVR